MSEPRLYRERKGFGVWAMFVGIIGLGFCLRRVVETPDFPFADISGALSIGISFLTGFVVCLICFERVRNDG